MAKNVSFSLPASLRTRAINVRALIAEHFRVGRVCKSEWCWIFDRAWGRSPPTWRISRSLLESIEIARFIRKGLQVIRNHLPGFGCGTNRPEWFVSFTLVLLALTYVTYHTERPCRAVDSIPRKLPLQQVKGSFYPRMGGVVYESKNRVTKVFGYQVTILACDECIRECESLISAKTV